jgi:DNA-binding transcriptional LysR family regulator
MDTLELIRTFREVAQRGSFSMAARTLDVSKANVSKYVAELETRLGVRLLNRTTRTVSLTDAGGLLLERSKPLFEMIELTRDELQHRARLPSGRVRLTAPIGLAHTELPHLLGEFMAKYPEVTISLQLDNRIVDLADEGIDIALRIGRIADSSLIVRRLQQLEFVVCAAPSYWQERGIPEHPDDLADHDTLTLSFLGAAPEWRFTVDGEMVAVTLRSRMDASDVAPLLTVALRGLGVIQLPRLLVGPHLASGALQAVLPNTSPGDIWLYAAYSQRRHNSAALKALLAFLEERWHPAL